VPVNPFCGSSETVTAEVVPPTCVETEAGETTILKSAAGGGGGGGEELPHAVRRHGHRNATNKAFLTNFSSNIRQGQQFNCCPCNFNFQRVLCGRS
jgi:hypothetical protein